MKLKLLVDAVALLSPLTGIGKYTYEISNILEKEEDLDLSYFYGYHSRKIINFNSHKNIKRLKAILSKSQTLKKISRKLLLASAQLQNLKKYDIYWQPNFIPNSKIRSKKIVTTVHDFSFYLYRDFHPKERIEHFDKEFLKSVHKSDFLLTGSNFTKGEILERLNFTEDRVKVIYHGVNHKIFKVYDEVNLSFDYQKQSYILSVW